MPPKVTVWKQNKFFRTTPFGGFKMIINSNSTVEIATWYVIIFTFSLFTIKNLISLSDEYLSGQTITRMKIGRFKDLSYPPELYVMVRVKNPLPRLDEALRDHQNHSLFRNLRSWEAELEAELGKYPTSELLRGRKWSYALIMSYYIYFENVLYYESTLSRPTMVEYTRRSSLVSKTIHRLDALNAQLNVSRHQMWKKFCLEFYDLLNLKVVFFALSKVKGAKTHLPGCTIRKLLFEWHQSKVSVVEIGLHQPTWTESDPENERFSFVQVDLKYRDDLFFETYGFTFDQLAKEFPRLYGRTNHEISVRHHPHAAVARHKFGEGNTYTFKIDALFRNMRNSSSKCVNEPERKSCISNCRKELVRTRCNCTSLKYGPANDHPETMTASSAPLCSLSIYSKCIRPGDKEYRCSQCPPMCTHEHLEVEYVRQDDTTLLTNDQMAVSVYNDTHSTFPIFVEEPAHTLASFLAQLGGTLDFYLGISVLGLIHLVLFFAKQVAYACNNGTKTGQRVAQLWSDINNPESVSQLLMAPLMLGKKRDGEVQTHADDTNVSLQALEQKIYTSVQENAKAADQKFENLEEKISQLVADNTKISQQSAESTKCLEEKISQLSTEIDLAFEEKLASIDSKFEQLCTKIAELHEEKLPRIEWRVNHLSEKMNENVYDEKLGRLEGKVNALCEKIDSVVIEI